jgi:hypothetical protein
VIALIAETGAHSAAGGIDQLRMQSRSECSGVAAQVTGPVGLIPGD